MKSLELNLPEELEFDDHELKMIIAAHLYQRGTLSLGQAAASVEMNKWDFSERLKDYGVSLINYSASEIASDVKQYLL